MNTLISGGAGFIGSHLADALIKKGHRVVCVDNFLLGTKENISHLQNNPLFKLYEQDICDFKGTREIFEKEAVDYVFHLAANSDIQAGGKDPFIDLNNTFLTTFNLLECMRLFGVKKLFFASTSAVYGEQEGQLPEAAGALEPVSYYGAGKLASEAFVSAYSARNDIATLVFRFPNVVGARLTHGAVYDFINKLKRDPSRLEILGDGKQNKPYMYVSDLINGIMQFMDVPADVTVYNIGVNTRTNVTAIADMVCDAMGLSDVKYEYTGGRGGWPGDVPEFEYNLSKIHDAGWKAEYTSNEAVAKTAKELCAQ
jgi:UDP-glucose 4-epimerase